jgi:hypothetical protein
MKYLLIFLSSASDGNIRSIKPQFQRLLQLLTGLIWSVSIIWTVYNVFQTTQEYIVYRNDTELLSEIQHAIESNPGKYQNNELTFPGEGVSYFNKEATLFDYFSKLSYYEPVNFNPSDVTGNFERAKMHLGSNPFLSFTLNFLVFIVLGNFLWWTLLRGSFWLQYGSTKN